MLARTLCTSVVRPIGTFGSRVQPPGRCAELRPREQPGLLEPQAHRDNPGSAPLRQSPAGHTEQEASVRREPDDWANALSRWSADCWVYTHKRQLACVFCSAVFVNWRTLERVEALAQMCCGPLSVGQTCRNAHDVSQVAPPPVTWFDCALTTGLKRSRRLGGTGSLRAWTSLHVMLDGLQ